MSRFRAKIDTKIISCAMLIGHPTFLLYQGVEPKEDEEGGGATPAARTTGPNWQPRRQIERRTPRPLKGKQATAPQLRRWRRRKRQRQRRPRGKPLNWSSPRLKRKRYSTLHSHVNRSRTLPKRTDLYQFMLSRMVSAKCFTGGHDERG